MAQHRGHAHRSGGRGRTLQLGAAFHASAWGGLGDRLGHADGAPVGGLVI